MTRRKRREGFSPSSAPLNRTRRGRRILGIDPGLASTGWGVIEDRNGTILYVDHGTIITKANRPRAERLFFILRSIRLITEKYKPDKAAIEILFFGKNVTSAIPVAEARGVISACLAENDIPLIELTPNAIKKGVTGISGADKKQVQEMVRIILNLEEPPKPDHAADALAAAITAANAAV
jgi:crossover junction endodeoxyribonuclease RuvC